MPATTLHRLGLGLVSVLATVSLAACGSDGGSPISGTGSNGGSSQGGSSRGASGGSEAAGSTDAGNSSSDDNSEFCDAYDLDVVKNAGTDPQAARDVLEKVAEVAPDEIKDDAELIFDVLDKGVNGQAPTQSSTEIRDASARVAAYYAKNCQ